MALAIPSGGLSFLPHLMAWNFVLGWVICFGLRQTQLNNRVKAGLVGLVTACAFLTAGPMALSFWTLSISVAVLVFFREIRLPLLLARICYVISQALFTIFLLHVIWLRVYTVILDQHNQHAAWAFAMLFSTASWVVCASIVRGVREARRRIRDEASTMPRVQSVDPIAV